MKRTGHIVPHTHWDREWRYPIWHNRSLLVDFIDELLETLEQDPEYKQFVMDGQSVVFEDYLQIRPEKKEQLKKHIKSGRITAGPWYTLPDLYPIDGECLIRNLLKGHRVSEQLGGTMNIAYTSFGWGQTAQLPQIYNSFGMDFCITAKRVSPERAPKSEFWWEAPDGSRILTTRLGKGGRSYLLQYGIAPIRRERHDEQYYRWNEGGLIYHKANTEEATSDYFIFGREARLHTEKIAENFENAWHSTDESISDSQRLLLLGIDFAGAESDISVILKIANDKISDKSFRLSTLQDYIDALKEDIDTNSLITIKGELRDGPAPYCSANGLASRMYIKQKNKKIQNELIYRAEPLMSAMRMLGYSYDTEFSRLTWDYILKSQPHDSINGVTQDKTANDVMFRLAQAEELTDILSQRGMRNYISKLDMKKYDRDDILLVVYNPLPFDRQEIINVSADIPYDRDAWNIAVYNDAGEETEIQPIEIKDILAGVHDPNAFAEPMKVERHVFLLNTGNIPAGGCRIFKIEPKLKIDRSFVCGLMHSETSTGREIAKNGLSMENEYLLVEINPNGTIKLTDKTNNRVYDNMHYFEDTGDVGSYWVNLPPSNNKLYSSTGLNADIWLEHNGALSATIGVSQIMRIPKEGIRPYTMHNVDSKRSDEYTDIGITSYFTLKKGERQVNVKVELNNTAYDHRLRVMYPTGIKAEYSYAAGHFNVDKRRVMPADDNSQEYFLNMQTLPQQTFVDVTDETYGIAFINNCLTEYELKNDGKGTLALTLLKSVKNNICTAKNLDSLYPEQNGGQCLGKHSYEYAIRPHAGNWSDAGIYEAAQKFNIIPYAMQTAPHMNGNIRSCTSLYRIDNNKLVMSALKRAEDRDTIIMRVFNPTGEMQNSSIKFAIKPKASYFVDMNENRIEQFDYGTPISVGHHKIITMEFVF